MFFSVKPRRSQHCSLPSPHTALFLPSPTGSPPHRPEPLLLWRPSTAPPRGQSGLKVRALSTAHLRLTRVACCSPTPPSSLALRRRRGQVQAGRQAYAGGPARREDFREAGAQACQAQGPLTCRLEAGVAIFLTDDVIKNAAFILEPGKGVVRRQEGGGGRIQSCRGQPCKEAQQRRGCEAPGEVG